MINCLERRKPSRIQEV